MSPADIRHAATTAAAEYDRRTEKASLDLETEVNMSALVILGVMHDITAYMADDMRAKARRPLLTWLTLWARPRLRRELRRHL